MGGAFIGLNGWGVYDYGWGIYDLNGWGVYGSNGWGIIFFFFSGDA